MRLHSRILTTKQQEVLENLGPVTNELGLYLGGGTAIALHLGHRRSEDFDWFTEQSFEAVDLAKELKDARIPFRSSVLAERTLWGTVRGIQFRHAPLRKTARWPRFGIRIAAIEDLLCMKLLALQKRGTKRDFVDVFAIGTWGPKIPLARMVALYQKRFEAADHQHVLYALTYFADAETGDMPVMLRDVSWDRVKDTVTGWVAAMRRR